MNIALWIVQVVLAVVFVGAGLVKATLPLDSLEEKVGGWVREWPLGVVRAIGALEVVGAVGLVLPQATDVAPGLVVAAAVGLLVFMVGAVVVHGRRGETKEVVVNVVLGALLVLVAVGRLTTSG